MRARPEAALLALLGALAGLAISGAGGAFDQAFLRWFLLVTVAGLVAGSRKISSDRDFVISGVAFAATLLAVLGFKWVHAGTPPWVSGGVFSGGRTVVICSLVAIFSVAGVWLAAHARDLLMKAVGYFRTDLQEGELKGIVKKLQYLLSAVGLIILLLLLLTGGADLSDIPNYLGE